MSTPAPPTGIPPITVRAAISAANAAISAMSVVVDRCGAGGAWVVEVVGVSAIVMLGSFGRT